MRLEANSCMCWKMMFGLVPVGGGMGAAGAKVRLACWFAWMISFWLGG